MSNGDTSAMGSEWATLPEYEANRRRTLSERILTRADTAQISSLACVGAMGEDPRRGLDAPNHGVHVGERSIVREFVTIHGGFEATTRIGDGCYIMSHAHVGHDCQVGNEVKLSTGAILGGHTVVHDGANIGLNATTHQRVAIGALAMVGAGSMVTKDVPPYQTWAGVPAKQIGWNVVGMERAGMLSNEIASICTGVRTAAHDDWEARRVRK